MDLHPAEGGGAMWFEELTGFSEESPEQVRRRLEVRGDAMISKVNGRAMVCGHLETPTLGELRQRAAQEARQPGSLQVSEWVGDVQRLHQDPSHAGAMFQVASQFNLLEMVSPRVTPEEGVGIYEYDRTQGPACAIAAGPGTIFRNYFAKVGGQVGQTDQCQIDCAADLGKALRAEGTLFDDEQQQPLWQMINGYLIPSADSLAEIDAKLASASPQQLDRWRDQLRIGLQWNVEVTLGDAGHVVSQAYCSALPVAYCQHGGAAEWSRFGQLILDGAYEATFYAAMLADRLGPCRKLFLTLLGGGAFGNNQDWIEKAIRRALRLAAERGDALDVTIVSYGTPEPMVDRLIQEFNNG